MTIINVKEWLAARPEDRKSFIESGHKLSKIAYKEAVIELYMSGLEETRDVIDDMIIHEKTYKEIWPYYKSAACIASLIYAAKADETALLMYPHMHEDLPMYYQIYLEEIEGK